MRWPEWCRAARRDAGFRSTEAASEALDWSEWKYRYLETGARQRVTLAELDLLADLFHVPREVAYEKAREWGW